MTTISAQRKREIFVRATLAWYKKYARKFPWRNTTDPYKILISEIMSQQTQISRIIPKYEAFITRFPTIESLAKAPLSDVLTLWTGLGYNRRAKYLHTLAKEITKTHNGKLPNTYDELLKLPSIGPYTAGAVCAFAYNQPVVVIDINIKRICNRVFGIDENQVATLLGQIVPKTRARDFYNALMDIAAQYYSNNANIDISTYPYTKICNWTNNKKIATLKKVKQSTFKNSNRYYRGQILKLLVAKKSITQDEFKTLNPKIKYNQALKQLQAESFVQIDNNKITLAK